MDSDIALKVKVHNLNTLLYEELMYYFMDQKLTLTGRYCVAYVTCWMIGIMMITA